MSRMRGAAVPPPTARLVAPVRRSASRLPFPCGENHSEFQDGIGERFTIRARQAYGVDVARPSTCSDRFATLPTCAIGVPLSTHVPRWIGPHAPPSACTCHSNLCCTRPSRLLPRARIWNWFASLAPRRSTGAVPSARSCRAARPRLAYETPSASRNWPTPPPPPCAGTPISRSAKPLPFQSTVPRLAPSRAPLSEPRISTVAVDESPAAEPRYTATLPTAENLPGEATARSS